MTFVWVTGTYEHVRHIFWDRGVFKNSRKRLERLNTLTFPFGTLGFKRKVDSQSHQSPPVSILQHI